MAVKTRFNRHFFLMMARNKTFDFLGLRFQNKQLNDYMSSVKNFYSLPFQQCKFKTDELNIFRLNYPLT